MAKYQVIVNMNIAFDIEADSAEEAYEKSQNDIELPHGYQDDTRDTQKVIRIDDDCEIDCGVDGSDEPDVMIGNLTTEGQRA